MLSRTILMVLSLVLLGQAQEVKDEWPKITYKFTEANTLFCAYVRQDASSTVKEEVPYGAWVYGWAVAELALNTPLDLNRAGILTADDPLTLFGDEYSSINWSAQVNRPPGLPEWHKTGYFAFCADVKTLPASGEFYLQVYAKL